jgi:hypothetical protein
MHNNKNNFQTNLKRKKSTICCINKQHLGSVLQASINGSTRGSGRSPAKRSKLHWLRVWSWGRSLSCFHKGGGATKMRFHLAPPHLLVSCPLWMGLVGGSPTHLRNGLQQLPTWELTAAEGGRAAAVARGRARWRGGERTEEART